MRNPECANELLMAMNVSNVRILPWDDVPDIGGGNATLLAKIREPYNGT